MGRINEQLADPLTNQDLGWLNDKNREVLFLLLDRIETSHSPKYLPVLKAWSSNTSRKLTRRIHQVIGVLEHQ